MKKTWITRGMLACLLSVGYLSGCSCDDSTSPPESPKTQLDFSSNTSSRYEIHALDTADAPLLGTSDTIIEQVYARNQTYQGKQGVTIIGRSYLLGSKAPDSLYYWQGTNGDLYQYNFGQSFLNSFGPLRDYFQDGLNFGWVLQVKMNAKEGDKWIAIDTNLNAEGIPIFGSITFRLVDSVVMQKDTQIVLGTKTYANIKHAKHILQAKDPNNIVTGSTTIDTYVSAELGQTVRNIIHSGKLRGAYTLDSPGEATMRISP